MVKGRGVGLLVLGFAAAFGCRASTTPSAPSAPTRPGAAGAASGATPPVTINPAPSPSALTLAGPWAGQLQALHLRVVVRFARSATGWVATLDSPDQHVRGVPIDVVRVEGDRLNLELTKIDARYVARIADDEIRGTFTQYGNVLPLDLKRGESLALPSRPQDPKRPLPYEEIELGVPSPTAGVTLACTLTEPPGKGPFGAVVLAEGSGPNDRDESIVGHKPFLVLSDAITRGGVAVLRCDKRGIAKSTGNYPRATTFDFADDVLAEVGALRARPDIDGAHVGVAGHSEGATVAAIAAAKSKTVAFVVLLAGPALPGDQLSNLQRAWFERAAGEDAQEIAATKAKWDAAYAIIKAEPDDAAATKKLRALYDALPASDRAQLGGPAGFEALARTLLSPWWRTCIALDPRTFLAQVTVPVLALNGSRDSQVEPLANLPEMKKALAQHHDVTVRELPGLNHLFQTSKTGAISEYEEIAETISPTALTLVSDWIVRHAK